MFRFLAAFIVLFMGGIAGIMLLPSPPKVVTPASAVAVQLHTEAAPAAPQQDVRVVYPAPGPQAPAAAAVPADAPVANSAAVVAPLAPAAVVDPQAQVSAGASATVALPADASAQAGTSHVDLNTASIEELNNIPGVGRIGRTIASHRPYHSVEDLLRKRVIRKSVYDQIKDQVAAQ